MGPDRFVDRVMSRAGLDSRERAVEMIRATLAILGARIYRTERDHLAAELPKALKPYLYERAGPNVAREHLDRFGLGEFYQRIRAATDTTHHEAVAGAQAVAATLEEAVSQGQLAQIRQELGPVYDPLFAEPGQGPARIRDDDTYPVEGPD